jgi:shikimate dehydrogenase
MLVAQAVRAAELFLDTTFAPTLTDKVVHDITLEKENLILVGMPASGKSSVGRRLAERLKRPCIDLDDEIVRVAGEPISAIFAAQGEEAFRDLESKVLFETVHAHTGAVICTGGGAPLREENRVALHQTGRVYWLDRPLEALCPTADRPTASDTDAMRARYKERLPVYRAVSDKRIDGDGDVETVAERVYEEFCK